MKIRKTIDRSQAGLVVSSIHRAEHTNRADFFQSNRIFLPSNHHSSPIFPSVNASSALQRQSLLCSILLARNPVPGPGYYSSINENVK